VFQHDTAAAAFLFCSFCCSVFFLFCNSSGAQWLCTTDTPLHSASKDSSCSLAAPAAAPAAPARQCCTHTRCQVAHQALAPPTGPPAAPETSTQARTASGLMPACRKAFINGYQQSVLLYHVEKQRCSGQRQQTLLLGNTTAHASHQHACRTAQSIWSSRLTKAA
jgi:hypothetical protein